MNIEEFIMKTVDSHLDKIEFLNLLFFKVHDNALSIVQFLRSDIDYSYSDELTASSIKFLRYASLHHLPAFQRVRNVTSCINFFIVPFLG